MGAQLPVVEVAGVTKRNLPEQQEWVGTTYGFIDATIRAQVQGYLTRQNYKEGDFVRKGQTLFEIDSTSYEAALSQAEAELARMQAQYTNAKANLDRIGPLAEQKAVSQKDLDDAIGAERAALASVSAARAAVRTARLNLGFTRIISPISGIAGIAQAQIGDLVGPNQSGQLTAVSTVNPIKVYYTVSEQFYIAYIKRFKTEQASRADEKNFRHTLILADGSQFPFPGKLYAIDREVDARTGTIRMAAVFPNPGNVLRPGQFVRVRVTTGTKKDALLVPQRAIMELQGSFEAAVVKPDSTVEIRFVKTGRREGGRWIVDSGLTEADRVVVEGVQKAVQGIRVSPLWYVATADSPEAASR